MEERGIRFFDWVLKRMMSGLLSRGGHVVILQSVDGGYKHKDP